MLPVQHAIYAVPSIMVDIYGDQHIHYEFPMQENFAWNDMQAAVEAARVQANNYLSEIINRTPQPPIAAAPIANRFEPVKPSHAKPKRFKSAEFKGAVRSQILMSRIEAGNGCTHGFSYNDKECLYSCSHWSHRKLHPNQIVAQYVKRVAQASAKNKSTIPAELDISYGSTPNQRVDIFGARFLPSDAPILAFIHGGYWTEGSRQMAAFMASTITSSGAIYVAVGYDLAPRATLDQMVEQVATAVAFLNNYAKAHGSKGLYIVGHSAGAHLACMALLKSPAESLDYLRGLFLLSGIYELEPLVDTILTKPLKLNLEMAVRNSPERFVDDLAKKCAGVFVAIASAEFDSPIFMENNKRFYELLSARMIDAKQKPEFHTIAGEDHFSIVERLDEKSFSLVIMLCRWMGVGLSNSAMMDE